MKKYILSLVAVAVALIATAQVKTGIEVLRDGESAPALRFHRGAEKRAEALGVKRSFVSITHERTLAAAQVLLEG